MSTGRSQEQVTATVNGSRNIPTAGLNPVHFSSDSNDWNTPSGILDKVRDLAGGQIGLDPCSNATSLVNAAEEWSIDRGEDGLNRSWVGKGMAFVNFPYGRKAPRQWTRKIIEEASTGTEIVVLAAARTDTRWFRDLLQAASAVCFIAGRVKFLSRGKLMKNGAPFPSAVLYFGPRAADFNRIFTSIGVVVRLDNAEDVRADIIRAASLLFACDLVAIEVVALLSQRNFNGHLQQLNDHLGFRLDDILAHLDAVKQILSGASSPTVIAEEPTLDDYEAADMAREDAREESL